MLANRTNLCVDCEGSGEGEELGTHPCYTCDGTGLSPKILALIEGSAEDSHSVEVYSKMQEDIQGQLVDWLSMIHSIDRSSKRREYREVLMDIEDNIRELLDKYWPEEGSDE